MAETFGFEQVTGFASGAASNIAVGIVVLAIVGVIGGILWYVWYRRSHKHSVIVRQLTKSGMRIIHDRAMPKKKDNADYWHLLILKLDVMAPPPEAIDLQSSGLLHAECYIRFDEKDNVTWIKDERETNKLTALDAQQRGLLTNRVVNATIRRKKSWLDVLQNLAVPIALVFIIGLAFVFWEDIARPAREIAALNVESQKMSQNMQSINMEIARQNAILYHELTGKDLPLNPAVMNGSQVIGGG